MKEYRTAQREKLYGIFNDNPHSYFTARELVTKIGETISLSAIYRNLADMEAEGLVIANTLPGNNTRRYRLAKHVECVNHLHFSCVKCGETTHLSGENTQRVGQMLALEGLQLDLGKTVISGICRNCQEAK